MKRSRTTHRLIKPIVIGLLSAAISAPALSADIQITVESVNSNEGSLMLAVFNSEQTFGHTQLTAQKAKAVSGDMKFTFNQLPVGEYALMVFHDVNGNGELDTNLLGMPTEPWGASLQGRQVFGPPGWQHTNFKLTDDDMSLTINLK